MPGQPARSWRALLWPLVCLGLLAALYLATLYPGLGGRANVGDSAKFQYVGAVLGVPHPPGYPQYVVLTHLWSRLPLAGELAWRINLFSAVVAVATAGVCFALVRRLGGSGVVAAAATWTLFTHPAVWTFATEAEVHALQLLYFAALALAVARLETGGRRFWLLALFALVAASSGNHPIAVVGLPAALAAAALAVGKRLVAPRNVAWIALFALLGVAQYGFVLWRSHSDAAFVEGIGRDAEVEDLARTVTGARFVEKNLLRQGEEGSLARLAGLGRVTASGLPAAALALALFGIAPLARRPALAAFCLLTAAGAMAFLSLYHIGDWEAYGAPVWLVVAVTAALGLERWRAAGRRYFAAGLVLWLGGLGVALAARTPAMRAEASPFDASALIALVPPRGVAVPYAGPGYRARQLGNYYRFGLETGERRGVLVTDAHFLFHYRRSLVLSGRPLYFSAGTVRRIFDRFGVDYVERRTASGRRYFVTGSNWPITDLQVVPLADGRLEIRRPGGELVATPRRPDQMAVIAESGRRVKAVLPIEPEESPAATYRRIRVEYDRLAYFDYVVFLLQRLDAGRAEVAELLSGVAAEALVGKSVVVAFPRSEPLAGRRVVVAPAAPVWISQVPREDR